MRSTMKMDKKNIKHWTVCLAVVLSAFTATAVNAAVSISDAEKLKSSLTPLGAQREGNGRDIPAWRGGLSMPPLEYKKPGQHHVDPFPQDKPLFTISAANMLQYQKYLTEGQKELFRTYPDTFRMPIYRTRRTAAAPEWVYENTYKNAIRAELSSDGNSLLYAYGGIPFPVLDDSSQAGIQALWNHITRGVAHFCSYRPQKLRFIKTVTSRRRR
jgi:hypothetical protein